MCGFAGVVTWDEKYRVTRDTLEKMSRAIAHRGPDGEGYHLTRENEPITPETPQVGFAFRRLAILDPDPRSNQPFHIGPLTLVFNGEIYNFKDLKSEISNLRPDYQWRTTGDTEVLLMAYDVWREKCVEKLNGMFAFAVWDEQKKELFLARDRMGQKPLFYAILEDATSKRTKAIAISSELGALKHLDWINQEVDDVSLVSYLQWGFIFWPTIYAGIKQLFPATTMSLDASTVKPRSYFQHTIRGVREKAWMQISPKERISETRRIVTQAVARQLVADVPIGCFLSGGIDSSVIALAMKTSGADTKTLSVGFDDARYDETRYAAAVAKHLGTNHREFKVRPNAAEDLPKLASVFGEPFGDSSALPTHYLARETRQYVKVALSGDGGDELFGGYDRYRALLLTERIHRLPRPLRFALTNPCSRGIVDLMPGIHPKSPGVRFKRLIRSMHLSRGEAYESYVRLFDDESISELREFPSRVRLAAALHGTGLLFERYSNVKNAREAVPAALAADRSAYLPGDLLTKLDRASMLHALEVRSPFMDHELVRFASTLTTNQLLKGGPKRMLREAFAKDLPDFVFKRKKMGFAVPIGEWFRGELRPMLRDNLFASDSFARSHFNMKVVERLVDEHEQFRVDHSQRLYALLMLELWWRQQSR